MYVATGTVVSFNTCATGDTTCGPFRTVYSRRDSDSIRDWEEKQYQALLIEILYNRHLNNLLYKVPKIKLRVLKKLCTMCIKDKLNKWIAKALRNN